jgi:hypothetical protein
MERYESISTQDCPSNKGQGVPLTTELAILQKAVSPVDIEIKRLYPFLDNLPASWLVQETKEYSHEEDSNKKT